MEHVHVESYWKGDILRLMFVIISHVNYSDCRLQSLLDDDYEAILNLDGLPW